MQAPARVAAPLLARLFLLVALALAGGCGHESPSPTAATPVADPTYTVESVTDGDTLRFSPSLGGATVVRFVNIDAAEINGASQEPWASNARTHLRELLPVGTSTRLMTDRTVLDTFGRLLARVIRASDNLDANKEQVRLGHAVTYVIWPNVSRFEEYRAAQIEAQDAGRGIWEPTRALRELPFEYRLKVDRQPPRRPAGDYFTRYYVAAPDYRAVDVNNRVFFASPGEAESAGYTACPREAGTYASFCFAAGS